jgi:monovalent cation:H+ antiporter-2, CPA2 family
MNHLPNLISDLALILTVAAVVSLLFKKLKQPVVLGYIVAGLLVGPKINILPTVVDLENIRLWADIGVIFLLFGLGLEFSFKKLLKVGSVAIITAFCGVSLTMLTGIGLGKIMGWNSMDSLFLGGILAISSTTIIIRAYDELKLKTQNFARIVTGALIVEDLVAVVLMVLLSSVAISRSFEGTAMLISVLKLLFFLVLWFVSGIFFLPTLIRNIKKLLNEESLLILSLALCFFMVWLATVAGFSSALGAFIMGSLLAETTKAERIEHLIHPLKDLFGAIFFVSVGLLIDPIIMLEYALPIVLASFVLLIGKPLFVSVGALLSGQTLKTSIKAGMSMSQIGEFSFIIAGLGLSLNVTSDFLYPIAVAISVITTFTTPLMMRVSNSVFTQVQNKLPEKWLNVMQSYASSTDKVTHLGEFRKLFRFYLSSVLVYSVVIVSVIVLNIKLTLPILKSYSFGEEITTALTLLILSPFLWALAFRRTHGELYAKVWREPSRRAPLVVLMVLRMILAVLFIGIVFKSMYSFKAALIGVSITVIILLIMAGKIKRFYGKIESRFFNNMNERENSNIQKSKLAPWDTHISTLVLKEDSKYLGQTLEESAIRENFGINIAKIERGDITINVPNKDDRLYPYDKVFLIGEDEQLKRFETDLIANQLNFNPNKKGHDIALNYIVINPDNEFIGKSIQESNIKALCRGIVVGIERGNQRILNPSSNLTFEESDKVWVVGDSQRIKILTQKLNHD